MERAFGCALLFWLPAKEVFAAAAWKSGANGRKGWGSVHYPEAIYLGKLAVAMIAVALLYYLLAAALRGLRRSGASTAVCVRLGRLVAFARATHPYLSTLRSPTAAYHVFVMFMMSAMGVKMWSGLLLSATVLLMANT